MLDMEENVSLSSRSNINANLVSVILLVYMLFFVCLLGVGSSLVVPYFAVA